MYYFLLFLSILFVSILLNISNIIVIKSSPNTIFDIIKIAFFILPIQFLVSIGFTYFYSSGSSLNISYSNLILINYGFGLFSAFLVQVFYFQKSIHYIDLIAFSLMLISILLIVFKDKLV